MTPLELNRIYNMDCLEGLKMIPDNSIDLVLTDPPYNINYYSNHGGDEYKATVQDGREWDNGFDTAAYVTECIRIAKPDSYILIFGCEENIAVMQKLGCFQILIWDKQHCGMGDLSDFGIGYEFLFYFKKGNPQLRGGRINGVLGYKHIGHFGDTLHPTQKPLALIRYIITKCSDTDGTVFDGCMGSGTTALAAKQTGRNFIGFEISEKYCKIANDRLRQNNVSDFL